MGATATKKKPTQTDKRQDANGAGPVQLTREQAAEQLKHMLSDEPQSEAALRRRLKVGVSSRTGASDVTRTGLMVLESRREAMRIPASKGERGGWVRFDAHRLEVIEHPDAVEFPYKWGMTNVESMFIDPEYQRPVTSFVDRITRRFNPVLYGVLVLSDRGTRNKPARYAIVDGQTRWVAARRLKIKSVPSIIFSGLTPRDEAYMFSRLQKERRAAATWFRFRADLAAEIPEALAINDLASAVGFKLGVGQGELKAIAALESAYRKDDFALARALSDLHDAWPKVIPEDMYITGTHYFLMHYPIGERKKKGQVYEINDEVLVRALQVAGPRDLKKAVDALVDTGEKGSKGKLMGIAIQKRYEAAMKADRRRR